MKYSKIIVQNEYSPLEVYSFFNPRKLANNAGLPNLLKDIYRVE